MPRYENQGFKSQKRIENDKKDRCVPTDENYYNSPHNSIDLSSQNNDGFIDISNIDRANTEYDVRNLNDSNASNIMDYNQFNNTERKSDKRDKKDKKKSSKSKSTMISIIAILLVIICVPLMAMNSVMGKLNYEKSEPMKISGLYSESGVKNVLLLGVDALSEGDHGTSRSDSMMLITLDSKHHCIKMTSFLRDSWVYIPKIDKKQRLNAACSYGGYQGVVDTIEYNYGIDIEGYVVVNFEMFETLVDSIGGVEVEVTEKEAKEINNHQDRYGYVTIDSGKNVLTGKQALAYCRIRKIDTDFVRTQRQRTVITAIINKMKSSNPFTLYSMASNAAPYVQTNLKKSQIMGLGTTALSCITGEMVQSSVPYDGTWEYKTIGGNSVISIDIEKNKQMLKDNLYNKSAQEWE